MDQPRKMQVYKYQALGVTAPKSNAPAHQKNSAPHFFFSKISALALRARAQTELASASETSV
jgi:hypothetical protein